MILTLLENLFPLIVLAVLSLLIYSIFFGIKELRYSLMPSDIGFKAAPLGCAASIITILPLTLLLSTLSNSSAWVFWCIFAIAVAVGVTIVCQMTTFFFNKAKAGQSSHPEIQYPSLPEYETKPKFGFGILLFIFSGIAICPLSYILFRIWVLPFLVLHCHLYYNVVEIPLSDSPGIKATISMTEYPIGFIPGNESSFILFVDDHKGNTLRFPDFIINSGSHYQVPIHYIPGKTTKDHGWLQFSNAGCQTAYLHLDSLQLTDELPDGWENSPRRFIGLYEGGKLDTNAKDPGKIAINPA